MGGQASWGLRFFVSVFIRLLLLFVLLYSYYSGRKLVFTMALIGMAVTFLPDILRRFFKAEVPAIFEVISLLSIYGLLVFWSVHLDSQTYYWWNLLINLGSGVVLGLAGMSVLLVLSREEIIDASSAVIAILAFCLSFSIGGMFEILEFAVDSFLGTGLQDGLLDTMSDLIFISVGSLLVAFFGYKHLRDGNDGFFSLFLSSFVLKNFRFFKSRKYMEYSSKRILEMIKRGEGEQLEFKSTLRKNLHTGKVDKKVEMAVLKTIVAYLNSKGGTILVGVGDKGEILGVDMEGFESNDKFKLYVTSILRRYIGNQFLPYIQFELYPIQDKHILKIDCRPSKKRVFLKTDSGEEFYVRYGPSTVRLSGNDLIDYVSERFGT